MHKYLKFIFVLGLYMFRTVSVSIIRSLALYAQQNLYDVYHCCVYSARLLMMDRGTVRKV